MKAREIFLDSYREFEPKLVLILEKNPEDGTDAIQLLIDFYANHGREFYLRNMQYLRSNDLDKLLTKITVIIESGELKGPGNHDGKREFGTHIVNFCSGLHKRVLAVT